ncbi:hypothetical protein BDZ91DRAFT_797543 [Kalaharituber pfeilii]|nr:hypothetical protein BDZ91DRAFT_797543 [Kalaharituber pfeilii]
MERAASAQSTITNTSVSSGDEMEWDGPGNTVNIVMPTVATVPAVRGTRMPETAGEEDPHTRFLNESKEWSRNVWERYEKGEVERLCRRRGVKENDMVYA